MGPEKKVSSPETPRQAGILGQEHKRFLIVPNTGGSALNHRHFSRISPVLILPSKHLKSVVSYIKLNLQQNPE